MTVLVHGSSDDNIELDGGISDEIGAYDGPRYLQFSEGTVIKIEYAPDNTACWRAEVHQQGAATVTKLQTGWDENEGGEEPTSIVPNTMNYSDVLEMVSDEDFKLLMCAKDVKELLDTSDAKSLRLASLSSSILDAVKKNNGLADADDEDVQAILHSVSVILRDALA